MDVKPAPQPRVVWKVDEPQVATSLHLGDDKLVFAADELPPLSFWEEMAASGPEDLSAEDLHKTVTQYCAVAVKKKFQVTSIWKAQLERDYGIDPYMLHHAAVILINRPPDPYWKIALHMLRTASDLGYTPSTLTVLRTILTISSSGPEGPKFKLHYLPTLDRLNRLVKVGDDPDALTLHGLLRLRAGNDTRALIDFDRAIEAGRRAGDAYAPAPSRHAVREADSNDTVSRQRRPRWTFESDCYLERGNILLRRGNLAAALSAFRVAAFELDSSAAYLQLAKLLPANSEERQECLLKSAASGSGEACRLLSEAETTMSQEAELEKGVVEEHMRWAAEWELLGELRNR